MKSIPAALAAVFLLVVAASSLINTFMLVSLPETLGRGSPALSEPIQLETRLVEEPTCTTKSKVIGGTTHTQKYTQGANETYEQYLIRMAREWALYCESVGDPATQEKEQLRALRERFPEDSAKEIAARRPGGD